eukprot:365977-Chlamydomonas_euryale.AAC.10
MQAHDGACASRTVSASQPHAHACVCLPANQVSMPVCLPANQVSMPVCACQPAKWSFRSASIGTKDTCSSSLSSLFNLVRSL